MNQQTGRSKGYAFFEFTNYKEFIESLKLKGQLIFGKQTLVLNSAKNKYNFDEDDKINQINNIHNTNDEIKSLNSSMISSLTQPLSSAETGISSVRNSKEYNSSSNNNNNNHTFTGDKTKPEINNNCINEFDDSDLLVLTLNQLGCLPEPVDPNQKINSIAEIQDNDFRIIIHRIINKIIQIKGMDVSFPENPSIDMTRKYQEAQKIAEFIKSLGYRGDLGMNSILHPSQRDKQRIIEFTLEIITSNDVGEGENIQGITEKNMSKIKISKILNEWYKDIWIIPELNNNVYSNKDNKFDEYILKIDNSKMKSLNKVNKENKIID